MLYNQINWEACEKQVSEIQNKIVAAHRKNDNQAVHKLGRQLVHSFEAKALAVRRVTGNKGKRTPGVDKITWQTPEERIFGEIGFYLWELLWKWCRKRHHSMPARELRKKYFRTSGNRNWVFFCEAKVTLTKRETEPRFLELFDIANVAMERHIKCRYLNPYDLDNKEYFDGRQRRELYKTVLIDRRRLMMIKKQKGLCPICNQWIHPEDWLEVHHIVPVKEGGDNRLSNLSLVHKVCHSNFSVHGYR